jgi:type IV pilus assembly protein PilA
MFMNNRAFTLVELLAVLIVLSIIITITIVSVGKTVSDSSTKLSGIQKNNIENAAKTYYLKEGMNTGATCVNVADLINKGYIEGTEVIDPKTNEAMIGSVSITYASNQYSYTYQDKDCRICTLENGTSKTIGAEYTCTLDTTRTFYVLGDNEDSSKIDLIMNMNYTDDTVPVTMAWCVSGSSNTCNHDNLDPLVSHVQEVFGSDVTVSLPSYDQIYKASGSSAMYGTVVSGLPTWLYDYLKNTTHPVSNVLGYWTSTPYASSAGNAWNVNYHGTSNTSTVSDASILGLRPVITISKSLMN